MKKIAIVGAGPTGVYTLFSLLMHKHPFVQGLTVCEETGEVIARTISLPQNPKASKMLRS